MLDFVKKNPTLTNKKIQQKKIFNKILLKWNYNKYGFINYYFCG